MAYIPTHDEGTHDADLQFSSAQAIPTDGADDISTNRIDTQVTNPRSGEGAHPISVKIEVTTLVAVASGTSSVLEIKLYSDSTGVKTIAVMTDHGAIGTLSYNQAKGTILSFPIQEYPSTDYARYLSLVLSPRSDDTLFSAGNINAWLEY